MDSSQLHEVSRLYREHISPDLARLVKFGGPGSLEVHSEGSFVEDHLGRRYLDFAGGYGVFNLGHRHPRVLQAVQRQLALQPLSSRVLLNAEQAYLARDLARVAPGQLRYSFFCNSGTEAVEAALKFARLATGRSGFVAAENSYHGKSFGSLSVTGREKYRAPFEPLVPGARFVPFGDGEALDQALDSSVAAFIIEPIQGEGGIYPAPSGYLQAAQRICRERGVLLIVDEVQCGLARSGRMFACEWDGIEPDLMALAKALGGGIVPMGAVMGTPQVWQALKGRPLLHTSTFGGNPLACAAARATLQVIKEDQLASRAEQAGRTLLTRLDSLVAEFPLLLREARGRGLMIGLEFHSEAFAGAIISEMVKRHVLAVYTLNQPRVIRLEPPLTISDAEIEQALSALQESLNIVHSKHAIECAAGG